MKITVRQSYRKDFPPGVNYQLSLGNIDTNVWLDVKKLTENLYHMSFWTEYRHRLTIHKQFKVYVGMMENIDQKIRQIIDDLVAIPKITIMDSYVEVNIDIADKNGILFVEYAHVIEKPSKKLFEIDGVILHEEKELKYALLNPVYLDLIRYDCTNYR